MRGRSQLVQLYTGAQINFGVLTTHLTYAQLLMSIPFNSENNSVFRSVEQEYVEANFLIAIPNHSAEEKTTQSKTRQLKIFTLWRILPHWNCRWVFSTLINFAERISEADMRRGNYMIRVPRRSFSVAQWGAA